MNSTQRKFQLLSPRKQLRELAALLHTTQGFLLDLQGRTSKEGRQAETLEAIAARLDWMASAGLYPTRLPRWRAAFNTILGMYQAGSPAKAILAAVNTLWHDLAERAEVSVKEENFIVRTNDRTAPAGERFPCHVVLDNIRSAFNTGSMLRSSDGFGVEEVILSGITAGIENEKVLKTAMGAAAGLPISQSPSLHKLIANKKQAGITVYALETVEGSGNLMHERFRFPMCLVMGNEEYGLADDYLAVADTVLHIPMFGLKNSFNVGVSCAIVLYEARRQWELAQA